MTLGIFMPKPNTGNSCSKVVMPPMIMAAWVSMIFSSADRPQVPAISMGGVMASLSKVAPKMPTVDSISQKATESKVKISHTYV